MVNMNANLLNIIDAFADRNLLVIGEAMLDSYMEGTAERLCREAPVPVVAINERIYVPGGAANAAVNVRSLGGEVVFLSVTGDDAEGDLLRQSLEERDVSTEQLLSLPQRGTLSKQRIIAASQMVVRFDQGPQILWKAKPNRLLSSGCKACSSSVMRSSSRTIAMG